MDLPSIYDYRRFIMNTRHDSIQLDSIWLLPLSHVERHSAIAPNTRSPRLIEFYSFNSEGSPWKQWRTSPESQGQNLALTVLYVPLGLSTRIVAISEYVPHLLFYKCHIRLICATFCLICASFARRREGWSWQKAAPVSLQGIKFISQNVLTK